MKKKMASALLVLTMVVSTCMVTTAAENPSATKAELHSEGVIRYSGSEGDVIIDTADFYTLADQLDLFKVRAVKQLQCTGNRRPERRQIRLPWILPRYWRGLL